MLTKETKGKEILSTYLSHLIGHSPVDDKTYAMCSKKDHGEMPKPNMILDARL